MKLIAIRLFLGLCLRNMDRSGAGQAVAMKITSHKTLSVYQRYRIVDESDIQEALERIEAAIAKNKERRDARLSPSERLRKAADELYPHKSRTIHHIFH